MGQENGVKRAEMAQLLAELSNAPGVSGFEDEVVAVLRREMDGLGAMTEDKMRNLYLERKENCDVGGEKRLTVMLDAHTDEVGFIVQGINANGMLRILPIGDWDTRNVPAQRVLVRAMVAESGAITESGSADDSGAIAEGGVVTEGGSSISTFARTYAYVPGITTSKPPHYLTDDEQRQVLGFDTILVDVGANSCEEVRALGIDIGAPIVPDVTFAYDAARDIAVGKAFDCRSGCAALVTTLRELAGEALDVNVVAAFSTQEEVGLRGAKVTAERVRPDVAIVFEGTPADDNFRDAYTSQTRLGYGPMLRHMDRSMITHPRFQRWALDVAQRQGLPHQVAVREGGGTNAGAIYLSSMGVPVIVLGVPARYIHTPNSMSRLDDHLATVELAKILLRELNNEVFALL
ncbi:MAG: M42 family metallopeptidase [Clostridiaceae bacterium]|nr:M42 family metallopeptidase [Clostridiaceae bacterium]